MKTKNKTIITILILVIIIIGVILIYKFFLHYPIAPGDGVALNLRVILPKIYKELDINHRESLTTADVIHCIKMSDLPDDEKDFYITDLSGVTLSLVTIKGKRFVKVEYKGKCNYVTNSGIVECSIIESEDRSEFIDSLEEVKPSI